MKQILSLKSLILSGLVILSAVLFWALLRGMFEIRLVLSVLVAPTIVLLFFAALVGLFYFLIDQKSIVIPTLLVATFSFFIFFKFHYVYLIGLILFFLGLLGAYHRIHSDKVSRIRISMRRSVTRGLGLILAMFAIIISLVYYFNSPFIKAGAEIEIPGWMISLSVGPINKMMGGILPFYDEKMTVDEFLSLTTVTKPEGEGFKLSPEIISQLKRMGITDVSPENLGKILEAHPELREILSDVVKEQLEKPGRAAEIAREREKLSKQFNIELRGTETIPELLQKIINAKINEFVGPYRKFISMGVAFGLFLLLRIIMIPFAWLVFIFAWILFKIMTTSKIVRLKKVQKEVEVVSF